MNRGELRAEVAFAVNFTEATASQDFVQARLNKAIQAGYRKLIERAKLNGSRVFFQMNNEFTWPADAQTLAVPASLVQKTIVDIYDITDGEPGLPIVVGRDAQSGGSIFWLDHKTWQWSTVGGPSSAVNFRALYEAVAENLVADSDVPELVPPQFHDLIVWEAAVLLRQIADEGSPAEWRHERDELRADFYKHCSRGRPASHVQRIFPSASHGGVTDPVEIDSVTPGTGLNPS
jgi:hypothetical protein